MISFRFRLEVSTKTLNKCKTKILLENLHCTFSALSEFVMIQAVTLEHAVLAAFEKCQQF